MYNLTQKTPWRQKYSHPSLFPKGGFFLAILSGIKTIQISWNFLKNLPSGKDLDIEYSQKHINLFTSTILGLSNSELEVYGQENLQTGPYIFLSNHRSLWDIPVIMQAIPLKVRMGAKIQLTRIPIFGRALVKSGCFPIDRKNKNQAINQLNTAASLFNHGVSLWMAPEGTRNRLSNQATPLAPLKKGPFHLAIDWQIPIVPVWIEGADKVLPPGSLQLRTGLKIRVMIGRPIDVKKFNKENIKVLIEQVKEELLEMHRQTSSLSGP